MNGMACQDWSYDRTGGTARLLPLLLILQEKRKNQVLYELCLREPIRFGELKKNLVGITNTVLTNSLRELEADGLISREQFNEIPPRAEYSFTQKGRDLMPVFMP